MDWPWRAGTDVCIKLPNSLFECTNADASLASLLLRSTAGIHTCISDMIRYDEPEKHYREYQKTNGKWLIISDQVHPLPLAYRINGDSIE